MLAALLLTLPAAAHADRVSCHDKGIACIADTGYGGEPLSGYPVDRQGNNCTTYVAYRLGTNGATDLGGFGDATHWAERAVARGFRVDQSPEVGSVAHWTRKGEFAPRYGHVAYVEKVTPRRIYLSDSNIEGGSKRWSVTRRDPEWPHGFIHIMDLTSGSVSIAPERTRVRPRGLDRARARVSLRLACPAYGTDCVTVIGGTARNDRRRGRRWIFRLGSRVIELEAGRYRQIALRLPPRLARLARNGPKFKLRLRIDSLGVRSPTFIRLRLG